LHPEGAYGRAEQKSAAIAALPERHKRLAVAVRSAGGWIVSTHFTLVPGRGGAPFISPHLKRLRPFLTAGDFAPGSFGQDLIEVLQPSDLKVEKVAFSAFYQSRMEWMLARAGIDTLIFGGIVTNGGVASTVRDAHVRDFHTVVLADGCAAFSQSAHDATIAALATISEVAEVDEAVRAFGG
jgi:nicotinamidase-related amidase